MPVPSFQEILNATTSIITIVGVPVGLFVYYSNKQKDRKEKEYLIYNSLDDKYIDFLKMCFDHPELNVTAAGQPLNIQYTQQQLAQRSLLYEILISVFERAYLLYKDTGYDFKEDQWKGWEGYIRDWMSEPSFRKAWQELGTQYAEKFREYMRGV